MKRFSVLDGIGSIVEKVGWLVVAGCAIGAVVVMLQVAAGPPAGLARLYDVGLVFVYGAGGVLSGLVTVALGQSLRAVVVIAKASQDASFSLFEIRRALAGYRLEPVTMNGPSLPPPSRPV